MSFGYTKLRNRFPTLPKQLTAVVSLLAVPITLHLEAVASSPTFNSKLASASPTLSRSAAPAAPAVDPRTVRLVKFFARLHCPVLGLAGDFIREADVNQLDWRLLPSISVIESGGGKAFKNNNIFGWNKGAQLFPSIQSGIKEVAYRLGRSPLYRNRDSVGKLRVYNPEDGYVQNVVTVMNRISPVVNIQSGRQAVVQQQAF